MTTDKTHKLINKLSVALYLAMDKLDELQTLVAVQAAAIKHPKKAKPRKRAR